MKQQDYEQLIYESFLYPGYAIADFFRKRQQGSGFSEGVFLQGLIDAYQKITNYLNSRTYPPEWTEDEHGNKEYLKNTINLFRETDGKISGTIWEAKDLNPVIEAIEKLNKDFQEQQKKKIMPDVEQPNIERLNDKLRKYSFFTLDKVKCLQTNELIRILSENKIPYQVAMLNYLGFIDYLDKQYCDTKKDLYKKLSEILNTTDRDAKGNINVLNENSKENKKRYTAHIHKETVQTDYEKLKRE